MANLKRACSSEADRSYQGLIHPGLRRVPELLPKKQSDVGEIANEQREAIETTDFLSKVNDRE